MKSNHFLSCSDEKLFSYLKKGVWPAFNELYNRYWEKLYNTAKNILNDDSASKDIVQEIFTDLWRRRASLQVTHVSAYLHRAVKFQVVSHIRSAQLHHHYLAQFTHIAQSNPTEENFAAKELEENINASISLLPPRCREVFYLSRYQSLTNKEISQQLNISVSTVENQINKALKHLRISTESLANILIWFTIAYLF